MNKTAAAVVFVILSAATYGLCANAHIDIFPCSKAHRERTAGAFGPPPLRTRSGTCSLLAHQRGTSPDGEYDRLTGGGWALLGVFCAGVGLAGGALVGLATRRRA